MNCVCVCDERFLFTFLKKIPRKQLCSMKNSFTLQHSGVELLLMRKKKKEVTKITMMKMIFRQRVSQNLAVWTIKNPQLVIKFDSKSHAWRHFPPCPPLPFSPFLFYPNVNIFCHVSMLASYSDSEPKVLRFWSHTAIKDELRDFSSF